MLTVLIIWAIFDAVVYLMMWYDRKDRNYDFKAKIRDFKDSFEVDDD